MNKNDSAKGMSIFMGIVGLICFVIGIVVLNIGFTEGDSDASTVGGIFCAVGGAVVLIMIANLVSGKKKENVNNMIKENGKILHGTIRDFSMDKTIRVNDRYPYIIFCTYTDEMSGAEYVFKSDRLWTNPELNLNVGDPINIYVNPSDYQQNYVDVEDAIMQAENRRLAERTQSLNYDFRTQDSGYLSGRDLR